MPAAAALAGAQFLVGGIQSLVNSGKARRAQKALENLQTPTTTEDAAINNYYNQANANPYATGFYKNQVQGINRGTATGLAGLQDRRSALAGVSSLVRGQNDALLRAGATAENQQRQMLGAATQMKANDNNRVWEINKYMPYQKQFALMSQKAGAANQGVNAGMQNMFGGLQTLGMGAGDKSWKQLFGGGQ